MRDGRNWTWQPWLPFRIYKGSGGWILALRLPETESGAQWRLWCLKGLRLVRA